ncbi:MAG: amidohydrolase family protein, partial [Bacteroidota bacterium]|nr:amidohydrolase family protein [Bacteroidota bacterium]
MRNIYIIFLLSVIAFMMSCNTMNRQADLIVHNARIYTVNADMEVQQAMVISDGMIVELGTDKSILERFRAAETIDCLGKPLFPGLIDAHCHFYSYGITRIRKADLTGTGSFEEILDILLKHHVAHPSEWLEGRGWDQNDWELKEFPVKERLDELFPNTAVILTRIDGHAVLVNSEAMKRAGITADTKIQGGEVKVKNGEPTGILIDNAINPVTACIPAADIQMQKEALLIAEKNCFALGLTSVVDAGLDIEVIKVIDSLHKDNLLKMRMNCWISPGKQNYDAFIREGIYRTDRLHVNGFKLYADGALGSRGACLLEPYSDDPGNSGLIMYDMDYYRNICDLA